MLNEFIFSTDQLPNKHESIPDDLESFDNDPWRGSTRQDARRMQSPYKMNLSQFDGNRNTNKEYKFIEIFFPFIISTRTIINIRLSREQQQKK